MSKYEMAEKIAEHMKSNDQLPCGLTTGQMTWALMALKVAELRACYAAIF